MRIDTITPAPRAHFAHRLLEHWPLLLGLAVVLIPTVIRLAQQHWSTEAGMHGPIVLATGIWLIAREKDEIIALSRRGSTALFLAAALPSLAVYVFGRAFGFLSLEATALLGLTGAIAYLYLGAAVLKHLWFPILYLCFLIPLPGWFMDWVTAPLKTGISVAAVEALQPLGYPIVREGVMLYVAQYQLLVKDACAGLNSLISLTSIGLFYIYLLHRASWRYSLFLLCWIIPVALLANFIRVVVLVLITYHFGDAMAQGFLHSTAGLLMFVTALAGIFVIDGLSWPIRKRLARRHA
jgi:exosortase